MAFSGIGESWAKWNMGQSETFKILLEKVLGKNIEKYIGTFIIQAYIWH
jgi:hypothetical protein